MIELLSYRLNTTFFTSDVLKSFDCGDSRLNDFLCNEAYSLDEENIYATTVYLINHQIVGFYTNSCSLLAVNEHDDFTNNSVRETMKEFSAIKIQYFAVDRRFQNQKIGSFMMSELLRNLLISDIEYNLGFKTIYLEAFQDAVEFYQLNGFKYLKPWEENYNIKSTTMILNYEELVANVDLAY